MENPVIIIGASGIGRIALDIYNQNHIAVYGFLDDDKKRVGTELDSVTVLGKTDDYSFLDLIGKKVDACVALDEIAVRKKQFKAITEDNKVMPVNAIHPKAVISDSASIGHGNLIDAGAVVSPGVTIEKGNLLLNSVSMGANSTIGSFCNLSAGVVIGDNAELADQVFVGTGAIIVGDIKIGKGARIGAGSVVVQSVAAGKTVFGNPAKEI